MTERILAELDAVERDGGVHVIYAVESGSRCWGFASPDSDYDVRFVYVRPISDYLKLEKTRDTIEWRLDDELDVVGWDVKKLLRLMRVSNPTVFEWLDSLVVYREEPCFKRVRDVALACFDPVSHAHHYLGMAAKQDVSHLGVGKVTLKRYLYALRALLAARWAVEERSPVPMAFEDLCVAKLEPELCALVGNLAQKKRLGSECESCGQVVELNQWVLNTTEDVKVQLASMKSRERVPWSMLDQVFVKLLYTEEDS